MNKLPIIALTMGDAAGIGPEIIVKTLAQTGEKRNFYPLIIGSYSIFAQALKNLEIPLVLEKISDIPPNPPKDNIIRIIDPVEGDLSKIKPGISDASTGAAALACIEKAVNLALSGEVDAIATAPISKAAIGAAGSPFPGHTEFLAHLTNTQDFAMLLAGGSLRVALATIHIALADVPKSLDSKEIYSVIRLLDKELPRLGSVRKKIAVAALNPHGGEGGLFGKEEWDIILPAIEMAKNEGIDASGPYPADSLFYRASGGEFDAVVAMYHDQGLIPLKLQAFHTGVNVTLGLPIIRTSPDHGCAFEIAGKNMANPSSMIEAVRLAVRMSEYN